MKSSFIYCSNLAQWHNWLKNNYNSCNEIWLIYLKKETGKATVTYNESVEEALCFGWIDSLIKTLDNERYARKFTPRKESSNWSEINKKRAGKMIEQNRIQPAGMNQLISPKKMESGTKFKKQLFFLTLKCQYFFRKN